MDERTLIEQLLREQQAQINLGLIKPGEGEQTWDTTQLAEDFVVKGFMVPYVIVTRKSDGKVGSLMFRHSPRVYFGWQED